MVFVRDDRELKHAWEMVCFLSVYLKSLGSDKSRTADMVKEYKQAIRAYNKAQDAQTARYLFGEWDYYTELIEFPENVTMDTASYFFDENYRLHCYPSQYDCTGQRFTTGIKFVERNGRVYGYHSVALDV